MEESLVRVKGVRWQEVVGVVGWLGSVVLGVTRVGVACWDGKEVGWVWPGGGWMIGLSLAVVAAGLGMGAWQGWFCRRRGVERWWGVVARAWMVGVCSWVVVGAEVVGSLWGWWVGVGLGQEVWVVVMVGVVMGSWAVVLDELGVGVGVRGGRKWAVVVCGVCLAGFVLMGLRMGYVRKVHGPFWGGDEPQYLLQALSIALDHDIELADNMWLRDGARYYKAAVVLDGHANLSPGGGFYSTHRPGLPVVLAPACAWAALVGIGLRKACTLVAWAVGVWLVWEVWALVRRGVGLLGAVAGVVCLGLSVPVVVYSNLLFPEVLGAAAGVGALRRMWLVMEGEGGWQSLLGAGVLAGGLGWVHEKFLITAGIVGLMFLWWRPWRRGKQAWWFLVPALGGLAGLMAYYQLLYAQPYPTAAVHAGGHYFNPRGVWEGLSGLWVDAAEGLGPLAPVWIVAVGGLAWLVRRRRGLGVWVVLAAVGQFLVVGLYGEWFGGCAPPARMMVAVVVWLAVGLGALVEWGGWWGRIGAGVAMAASAGGTVAEWRFISASYGHKVVSDGAWYFQLLRSLLPTYLRPYHPRELDWVLGGLWMGLGGVVGLWMALPRRFSSLRLAAWALVWMGIVGVVASAAGWAGGQRIVAPQRLWQRLAGVGPAVVVRREAVERAATLAIPPGRFCHPPGRRRGVEAVAEPGGRGLFVWGRYLLLAPGRYVARAWVEAGPGAGEEAGWVDVSAWAGLKQLGRVSVRPGHKGWVELKVEAVRPLDRVEVRVGTTGAVRLVVRRLELKRVVP